MMMMRWWWWDDDDWQTNITGDFLKGTLRRRFREKCQKLRIFCDFNFWSNPLRESGCRVLKTTGFLQVFLAWCTPLRENKGQVSKMRVFCVFRVLRIVLMICFVTCSRFFERAKMSENRQKSQKLRVFAILVCPNLCSQPVLLHTASPNSVPRSKRCFKLL